MITSAANTIALNSVIASVLDTVSVISVKNSSGEFFRKIPTATEIITASQTHFTFYLNENEANDTIIGFSLFGNGATATLGTGAEIATQAASIVKDNTQSVTVDWTVSIV